MYSHTPRVLAGSDSTEAFEDTGHSSSARKMMAKYEIGSLEAGAAAAAPAKAAAAAGATAAGGAGKGDHGGSMLAYIVPVLMLAGVLYYQFVYLPAHK